MVAAVYSVCNSAGIPTDPAAAVEQEATTADPAGRPHRTHCTCRATWRREPVNRFRPELGTTTQFGHRECGEPATVDPAPTPSLRAFGRTSC
ncbi:hypothetical protein ACFT0G_31120 [Streptomyces sp. NPDC057020]|uniref:hypothetical protein n=1 Tax=unclassified Streptomyces TaxID=2593676 RepID=UPI00363B75EF